jgi:hypothetical protein
MLPNAGLASMVVLSDDQLSEVIGQAGIAADVTHMTFDRQLDSMPTYGGIFSLSDVTIKGSIDVRNAMTVTTDIIKQATSPIGMMGIGLPGSGLPGLGTGLGMVGVVTQKIDMAMDLDQFTVGAIRVGSDPTGPSLGSLGIYGMHADIQGTVSISTH